MTEGKWEMLIHAMSYKWLYSIFALFKARECTFSFCNSKNFWVVLSNFRDQVNSTGLPERSKLVLFLYNSSSYAHDKQVKQQVSYVLATQQLNTIVYKYTCLIILRPYVEKHPDPLLVPI